MSVTVANPIHPLNGQTLTVRYIVRAGAVRVVHADHPDGGTIVLPESVLVADAGIDPGRHALFSATRLLDLVDRVAVLMASSSRVDVAANVGDRGDPRIPPPDAPDPTAPAATESSRGPALPSSGSARESSPAGRRGRTGEPR